MSKGSIIYLCPFAHGFSIADKTIDCDFFYTEYSSMRGYTAECKVCAKLVNNADGIRLRDAGFICCEYRLEEDKNDK